MKAWLRIAALVPATLVGIPLQWAALKLDAKRAARIIPLAFHRYVCRVLGFRAVVHGSPPRGAPALILSNHVSWADITVISSVMPVSFIAKSEVAGWPLFGLFARLQRTVFVDRERRSATADVNAAVAARLTGGEAIVLFGEGTTGDGNRILPFRSALVGAAREALAGPASPQILLQPLTIAYVAHRGLPLCRSDRPGIAWYGDMNLAPHLMDVLRNGPYDVALVFGEPIPFDAATDRKAATRAAEEQVRSASLALARGLPPPVREVGSNGASLPSAGALEHHARKA